MYILVGILLIAIGSLMLLFPKGFYAVTQGWKNDTEAEPSKLYIFHVKFGGVFLLIFGVASCVVQFIQ